MNEEFITALRAQVVEATARHERRGGGERTLRAVLSPPRARLAGAAAAVAVAAAALAIVLSLGSHTPPEPTGSLKLVARLPLAGGLGDSAQTAFGSVWLDDAQNRRVLRVDPRTHRVIARIAVPGDVTLAATADALWIVPRTSDWEGFGFTGPLWRVDPRTNRVTARVPVRTPSGGRFIGYELRSDPVAKTTLWLVGGEDVLGLDTRSLRVTQAVLPHRGPTYVTDFHASAGGLWITTDDNRLVEYDRTSHKQIAAVRLPGDLADIGTMNILSAGDRAVVLCTGANVASIDPRTGAQLWRTPKFADVRAVTLDKGRVWIVASASAGAPDRLLAYDPRTGALLSSTPVPDFSTVAVLPVGTTLWIPTLGGTVDVVA